MLLRCMLTIKAKDITLWMKCFWKQRSSQRKRSHSPSASGQPPASKRSNYDSHLTTITEVEMISDKLKEKHDDKYTTEQFRAWAHDSNEKV